jgi:hypothetical protein
MRHDLVWIRDQNVTSWIEDSTVQPSLRDDVDLCLNGRWRTVTANITDRSAVTYPILLGRDVLEAYTLDSSQTVEE